MKTGYKVMLGALAFVVTNVYAAEIMKKRTLIKSPPNTRKLARFPPPGNVAAGRQRRFNQKADEKGRMWWC